MKIDSFSGYNRFLSNFYSFPMAWKGMYATTLEHHFQAEKTDDPRWKDRIRNAESPAAAKKLGKLCPKREDWESVRTQVMLELLRVKFRKGSHMAARLEMTFGAELIEGNTWGDVFWGVCKGVGENWLGKLLMQVREENRA